MKSDAASSAAADELTRKPILIVPGFMSSGLHVESSRVRPSWQGDRLWLSLHRLGFSGKLQAVGISEFECEDNDDDDSSYPDTSSIQSGSTVQSGSTLGGEKESVKLKDDWLSHMALLPDLVSERDGVRIRPVPGLEGVDFLAPGAFTKSQSWVFGPVIKVLVQNGYKKGLDLDGAPYDWRVPPQVLEHRDAYFTKTMQRLEEMRDANGGQPVVVLGHSMGGLCGHYLLNFCRAHKGPEWMEKTIDSFVVVGSPHLGSPSALKSVIIGSNMGLPSSFLNKRAALIMGRSLGSSPWLLPVSPNGRISDSYYRNSSDGQKVTQDMCIDGTALVKKQAVLTISISTIDIRSLVLGDCFKGQFRLCIECYGQFVAGPWMVPSYNPVLPVPGPGKNNPNWTVRIPVPADFSLTRREGILISIEGQRASVSGTMRRKLGLGSLRESIPIVGSGLSQMYDKSVGKIKDIVKPARMCEFQFTLAGTAPNYSGQDDSVITVIANLQPSRHGMGNAQVNLQLAFSPLQDVVLLREQDALDHSKAQELLTAANSESQSWGKKHVKDLDAFAVCSPQEALQVEGGTRTHLALWRKAFESNPLASRGAPPVKKVLAVYGVNINTEVHQLYARAAETIRNDRITSKFELDKKAILSPDFLAKNGLLLEKGCVSETRQTPQPQTIPDLEQPAIVTRASGDGTVPYQSLRHVLTWRDKCDVDVHELDCVKHRGILNSPRFHRILLEHCIPGIVIEKKSTNYDSADRHFHLKSLGEEFLFDDIQQGISSKNGGSGGNSGSSSSSSSSSTRPTRAQNTSDFFQEWRREIEIAQAAHQQASSEQASSEQAPLSSIEEKPSSSNMSEAERQEFLNALPPEIRDEILQQELNKEEMQQKVQQPSSVTVPQLPPKPSSPPPPPPPPSHLANSAEQCFQVTIPPGLAPGATFHINANGQQFALQVPPNAQPGQVINVNLPALPAPQVAYAPPSPPPVAVAPKQQSLELVVPQGVLPGGVFQIRYGGNLLNIPVPANKRAGDKLNVLV